MELLKLLRWQDILDILLVWIILYRLLLIIKGTRAAYMLVGIGVLLLISLVLKYGQLHTLDWIIQSFWAYIVIAMIVLFQPEFRRALAQVGETPFLRFTSAEELKSLDEIVKAAASLSARRIGAIIVVERDTNLNEFIEIGVPLDSRVSREILLSIFHPTSPIHDGAVVIKDNRIVAAGCFLPISLQSHIDKDVGTRHRAGMAITEETDAVAIIVSEETGGISVSTTEEFNSKIDMLELRSVLTDLFTESRKK